MRVLYGLVSLLLWVGASHAQDIEPIVDLSAIARGTSYFYAITASGDLYRWHPVEANANSVWTYSLNIRDAAGHDGLSPFVSISIWADNAPMALTAAGEYFEYMGPGWNYRGRIGDLSGHEPTGAFVGIDDTYTCAITDRGEIYQLLGHVTWEYLGSIEDLGVVANQSSGLGDLKSIFR